LASSQEPQVFMALPSAAHETQVRVTVGEVAVLPLDEVFEAMRRLWLTGLQRSR
jgi:hypothetical protein